MAYVTIPKDLSKVKNKVFLNLTKRQLVCMGFAAGMGVPFYLGIAPIRLVLKNVSFVDRELSPQISCLQPFYGVVIVL